MKKAIVVLLVASLSLAMLAFLGGCGGDANKDEAKDLMTAGDIFMDSYTLQKTELNDLQTDLATTAMGGDISALGGDAGAAMQEQVQGLIDGMESDLESARAEYEAILALDGVQDYKDYASKMLEAIDAYAEELGYINTLVGKLTQALAAMAQGQDIDIITMMMESEELQKIDELGKLGDELVEEADQIKLDKKLEG